MAAALRFIKKALKRHLQKFSSVHASVHNHFAQERHLVSRKIYKERRATALAARQSDMA